MWTDSGTFRDEILLETMFGKALIVRRILMTLMSRTKITPPPKKKSIAALEDTDQEGGGVTTSLQAAVPRLLLPRHYTRPRDRDTPSE